MIAQLHVRPRRPGLTLMELVVVMAILIALAAILVPLFPSMIGRAHKASESTNTNELNKSLQLFAGLNGGNFPDGYDLLGDGKTLAAYLPASPTPNTTTADLANTVGGFLNPQALDAPHAAALSALGITQAWPMFTTTQPDPFTPTFNPYSGTTPVLLSSNPVVAYVSPAGIIRASITSTLNVNGGAVNGVGTGSSTQFVLFGIGNRCTMIGKTMANAPSLFTDNPTLENPAFFYERFGVIFQVEDANGNVLSTAQFIGAVSIESDGLEGADRDLEGYYQNFGK